MKKILFPLCLSVVACNSYDEHATDINHAPTIEVPSIINAVAGQTTKVSVIASDKDGDILSYSLVNAPSWVSIQDNIISVSPGSADAGKHAFNVRVSDGDLSTNADTALVVRLPLIPLEPSTPIGRPEISQISTVVIPYNKPSVYTLSINDDKDAVLDLDVQAVGAPDWFTVFKRGSAWAWSTTIPSEENLGKHEITITAKDSDNNIAKMTFTLIVDRYIQNDNNGEVVNEYKYRLELMKMNLPDYPDVEGKEVLELINAPWESYANVSSKGNDAGSTKKEFIVNTFRDIRHRDPIGDFAEYNGGFIFDDAPVFPKVSPEGESDYNVEDHNVGVYKKQFLENRLDFYNYLRSLFGAGRSYMSGYKQASAQLGSWVGRTVPNTSNGHKPSKEFITERLGITHDGVIDAIMTSRGQGNIQVGTPGGDQSTLNHFSANRKTVGIWNEGSGDEIQGLGHRKVFLTDTSKDAGLSTYNFSLIWLVWASNPDKGYGFDPQEERAYFESYPELKRVGGVKMYPSHGYFPVQTMLANQTVSLDTGEYATMPNSTMNGEAVELKMELFRHKDDGDLTLLNDPIDTFYLSDILGSSQNSGGESPVGNSLSNGSDFVGTLTEDEHPLLGRWHFTTSGLRFRMPQGWWNVIENDVLNNYYTIRYTFDSGENGKSFKVTKPNYMNPVVGRPFVAQTTFFDMHKELQSER